MGPFQPLVDRARREWNRSGGRLAAFPEISGRLLRDFDYDLSQDQLDRWLVRWLRGARRVPEQVSLHNTFGQPPITLFNNGRLVVDLYLWVAADTTIHSHGFRGAFRVLHGRSLHETYRVDVSRRIAPGVLQGELGVPRMEILERGDVRLIRPGGRLTHRVIHLENPTVTLCVKTINEPDLHQWDYGPDGLAVQRLDLVPKLIKEIYVFDYLLGRDAGLALRHLRAALGASSVVMRMTLHEALGGGVLEISEKAVDRVLAELRRIHGKAAWFKRRASPKPLHLEELQFAGCRSALQRLAAHFINAGHDLETIAPLLDRVAGRPFDRDAASKVLRSLLGCESIFGCRVSPEDRAAIREAVLEPEGKLPRHLQAFGQVRRMRRFLRRFSRPGGR